MDLGSNIIQMVINIREDGVKIRGMGKVLFGLQILKIN